MRKHIAILTVLLMGASVFGASPWPSSDVYPRMFGTNKTDTVMNTALTAIGTRVCRVIVDGGTWTISNNVTFPTNTHVYIAAGSKLSIANGKIVTFNGGFDAGAYDVFDGTGVTAGSPKMMYRLVEWGSATTYPMGVGATDDLLASNKTVSGVWLITNAASSFGGVLGANIPDLTAAEIVSGAWVHSANLSLDDGVGDSPSFILQDADNKTFTIAKLDAGNTTFTSTEGDFLFTPYGDDFLLDGGLTVGSATEAGDNNLRVEGDGTFNGNILGDDATIISNIATIATDLLVSDGAALTIGYSADTTAITSSDWAIGATGIASGLGTIGCDGNITLTAASGDATISSIGASSQDGMVLLDADAGGDNADSWWMISRASDNYFVLANHTTTNLTVTATGNGTITGDWDIDGNDLTSPADLTITPAGNEVLIDGGLNVGGTTQPGDNNLRVEGTSAFVGAGTATADFTFNGGIIGDQATDITLVDEATFVDLTVTNSPSFVSRYALLSKDTSTQYATEHGTCTNLQAVSFTTAFAVAPQIFLTYQAAATTNAYATSITVNGFTAGGELVKSMAWYAIGQK